MLRSSFFWAAASLSLLRRRRQFVMQTDRTDCGVASALSVLNMLGRPADPVEAVAFLDSDRAGTSLDELRRYFEEHHGIAAKPLSVPARSLGKLRGRVILHMEQLHYVVLLRQGKTGVLVFDPAMGPVFYPHDDFAALYSGHLLEIGPGAAGGRSAVPAVNRGGAPVVPDLSLIHI